MSENSVIYETHKSQIRPLETVKQEIISLTRQAQVNAVHYACEIGKRLIEAKAQVGHGAWGEWLKNEVDYSQSTAENFMRIYKEYGNDQLSLFSDFENSQTIGRLDVSKLLLLTAIPEDEREDFAKEADDEKISVRELCERADLNRSTFYAHYSEPKELLEEVENELLDATQDHLKKIGAENDLGAHRYLLSFLMYIKENDKPFRTLLVDSVDPAFRSKFMQQSIIQFIENLNIVFPKEQEQYIYSYILNGSTGVIIQWIRSDYCVDEGVLVDLLFSINQSALVNLDIKPRI